MRNRKILLPLFLALVLVLAACGGGNDAGNNNAADNGGNDAGNNNADNGNNDSGDDDTAAEPATIYIGSLHPLTGGLAADGIQMDAAIQMAIDEINAAGGIASLGGAQLALLSADTTGSAEVGQTEAERLIGEGAVALIGAFQSSVTVNIASIAEREGVPLLIDVALSDSILEQGFTYTFRTMANATVTATLGAQYLQDVAAAAGDPLESVVYLFEGTTGFGDSARAAFANEAGNLGINILDEISYEPFAVTDLTTEMTAVDALAPDALIVTGYYGDGLLAAQSAEDVGVGVKAVYGIAQGTYDQAQFVADAGDLAQCFFDANYHWDAQNPDALAVLDAWAAQNDDSLRAGAFLSYQVTYLLADAIERAASADSGDIRDAIAASSYEDHLLPFTGPIEFNEAGENVNAVPVLMQVQDGAVVQVWPPELAQADPIYPCTSWE